MLKSRIRVILYSLEEVGLEKGHQRMAATRIMNLKDVDAQTAAAALRLSLNAGGIVAFPTETVYGLGVLSGNKAGLERLYAIKGREETKFMAQYVDSAQSAFLALGGLSLRAEKMMRAFWPGPLTLVLPQENGVNLGLRCSSHPVANMMTTGLSSALLGTSANKSGLPPLQNGAQIAETFPGEIDLIIDQGENLEGRASTVLELPATGGYKMLRPGDLDLSLISSELELTIVFVCTGNTCRSPLAEVMFRASWMERQASDSSAAPVEIHSAGISAATGSPASRHSREVAQARGLDLESHCSRYLDSGLIRRADRIYTMTAAHRDAILYAQPDLGDRVRTLDPDGHDIADPFGGTLEEYEACADEIAHALKKVVNEL